MGIIFLMRWVGIGNMKPVDLAGYIPDFLLKCPGPLFVEVKPEIDYSDLEQHHHKARRAGAGGLLVVGAFPFHDIIGSLCSDNDLVEYFHDQHGVPLDQRQYGNPAKLGPRCSCADFGSPALVCTQSEVCACQSWPFDRGSWEDATEPEAFWKTAKNSTQWRRPRGT